MNKRLWFTLTLCASVLLFCKSVDCLLTSRLFECLSFGFGAFLCLVMGS